MSITNFNTENNSFSKLISDRAIFKIPKFQRDYSWSNTEWIELWEDIDTLLKEDDSHYMGYLVLQAVGKNTLNVIDGQQRITTLSLIILAAMKSLKKLIDKDIDKDNNQTRLNDIRNRFIGYQDNVTLINKNKLELNRNNNRYYKDYIVPILEELPKRNFNESEHLLRKAFLFFNDKIESVIKDKNDKGAEIAKLVENIVENLFFTVITVTNELNAYKVFETLNSRGVKLSSTDLLKNYLFSIVDTPNSENASSEVEELEEKWNRIVNRLGNNNISDYLRVFWLSKYEFVRSMNLFKTIRGKIKSREDAFRLINDMDQNLDTYLLCVSPEQEQHTSNNEPEIKASKLLKLFRIKQHYPIIMAAKRKFTEKEFQKTINYLSIIAFRYTVIGNQPHGDPEKIYFSIAQKIEYGELKKSINIAQDLKVYYLSDKNFTTSFENKLINTKDSKNNKIARYIYSEIEGKMGGNKLDPDDNSITIEHILPQNPNDSWGNIKSNDREKYTYHIGNMILLEKNLNKEAENDSFERKIEIFRKSKFKQVSELVISLENDKRSWDGKSIEKRANALSKYAADIWKIQGLD
ncbi:hypothetical protein A4G20_01705 [Pasteurellaceae bacterium RH1A]|nr:hypothetical protein A4G20_01705 [Pasteurellaceae bacterium RH1A]